VLRPYLVKHVRLGAPILYIYDSTPRARLMSLMRTEDVDPDELIRRGVLRALPSSEVYLRDGGFSVDEILAFVEKSIREMLSGGKNKALITGEMSWYFSDAKGASEILDYERRLNHLADKFPQATIICQYHIDRFDSAMTLGALCAHPVVELSDRMRDNPAEPGLAEASLHVFVVEMERVEVERGLRELTDTLVGDL